MEFTNDAIVFAWRSVTKTVCTTMGVMQAHRTNKPTCARRILTELVTKTWIKFLSRKRPASGPLLKVEVLPSLSALSGPTFDKCTGAQKLRRIHLNPVRMLVAS